MNIYQIGLLEINLPRKGVNRAIYATEFKNGKLQFTKAADKAKIEEEKKITKLLVPITNIAFEAQAKTAGMFDKWIKALVCDILGNSNKDNFNVPSWYELRENL